MVYKWLFTELFIDSLGFIVVEEIKKHFHPGVSKEG